MALNLTEDFKINTNIDDKLKDISDSLDLKEAPPIHQKRLVTFFNHFILNMVDFLNYFTQSCSNRLFQFEQKINKIEAELCLLESKLSSIPELNAVTNNVRSTEEVVPVEVHSSPPNSPPVPTQDTPDEAVEEAPVEVDPALIKYHKMLKFGVPLEGVERKMRLDGVDPSLLRL